MCVWIGFEALEEMPYHVQEQIKEEQQHEQRERERQEWEKSLCKVEQFC